MGARKSGSPPPAVVVHLRDEWVDAVEIGRKLFPDNGDLGRPKTRADCASVPRPCPFVGCRYNLWLDVHERTGAIKFNRPDREPDEVPADESCALDVAERGGLNIAAVGELLNLRRQQSMTVEQAALKRVPKEGLRALYEDVQDHHGAHTRVHLRVVESPRMPRESEADRDRRSARHKRLERLGVREGQRGELVVLNKPGKGPGEAA